MSIPSRVALVRRPGPRLAEGLVTHGERRPVDLDLALAQWHSYAAALRDAGWPTLEVPPADDCPDAVFVEDTVVVRGGSAVLARPGAPSRRGEVAAVEQVVRDLGLTVATIEGPGTLDGGDVLQAGPVVYVGLSGRTNGAGVQQLARCWEPLGVRVQAVPVERTLHLKSACTVLPDGTVIGWDPVVDDRDAFPGYLGVPEEPGAHVVLLGGDRVLLAAAAPRTARLLEERGLQVSIVDISEFEKLEGRVTCLSVLVGAVD